MFSSLWSQVTSLINDLALIETNSIMLVILLVIAVIVVDGVSLFVVRLKRESGLEAKAKALSIDGGKSVPSKNYISDTLLLAGRPDAVIMEDGFPIPVEHKTFAKKIHDRYVAQLLVYMRLVEEQEGKRPPYGYLILGPQRKKVRIENTEKRQLWLDKLLNEMHAILDGAEARATPVARKCRKCDVREHCNFKINEDTPVKINNSRMRHMRGREQ